MLNREVDCPIDLMVGLPTGSPQTECPIKYVEWVQSAMLTAFQFINKQLDIAASRQRKNYDRGLKPREFTKGN